MLREQSISRYHPSVPHWLQPNPARSAFTLIEILVVMACLVILIALLSPTINNALEKTKSTKALSNLRQIMLAAQYYVGDHDGIWAAGGAAGLSQSLGQGSWYGDLWSYAYPGGKPPYPTNFSASSYGGDGDMGHSIFYTPLLEPKNIAPQARSFGINSFALALSFPSLRWNLVDHPSKTCYLTDTKTSSSLSASQVNPRYRNSLHVAFLDSHVELVPMSLVPPYRTGIFWSGRE